MKMIKKLIITIIFIILAILVWSPNKTYARTCTLGSTVQVSELMMRQSDDIYCVSFGKHFGSVAPGETPSDRANYKYNFRVKVAVEIEGNVAKFTTSSGSTATIEHPDNGVLGAILGGSLKRGYGSNEQQNPAQLALYSHWNTWVANVGEAYGFQGYTGNANANGSGYLNKAKGEVSSNIKATIYMLIPQGEAQYLNVQELIIVDVEPQPEIEEEKEPGQTVVKGEINISGRVWEDIANSKNNTVNSHYEEGADLNLSGIKVYWKSLNGNEIASTTTGSDGTYTLSTELELWNHPYGIKDKEKYDLVNNSYIEFEYNGLKYTTVAYDGNLSDETSSKGRENDSDRKSLDNKFNRVEDGVIYDANNNIVLSNSSDTSITDSNYTQEFSVSASTGASVGGLLYIAEGNGWTQNRTFCNEHCGIGGKHLAHTYTKQKQEEIKTSTDEYCHCYSNGNNEDERHESRFECPNWYYDTKTVTYEAKAEVYCTGEVVIQDPHDLWTAEEEKQFKELIGDQYNSANGGLKYYSAEETSTIRKDCRESISGIWQWNIYNMNLGLVRREQPDVALASDIEKVRVIMKGQEYTYVYGERGITDQNFDYQVKFENKYLEQRYSRPVNPSDVAYVNYHNSNDLNVYVTYNIVAINNSNTLPVTIKKIINYYDDDYTIYTGTGTSTSAGWSETNETITNKNNETYKFAYNTMLSDTTIDPHSQSEIVKIEFEVSQEKIKGLLNEDAPLNNVSEIYSYSTWYGENTICAERETAKTKNMIGHQYAGIDKNSTPGNTIPGEKDSYEDDTDKAPTFLLTQKIDEETGELDYKVITGTVWEDSQTSDSEKNNERLGNGVQDEGEKGIQNVKVELLNAETGEIAYMYFKSGETADRKLAVTYTDENGNYSFGKQGECGVAVNNYIIKYTYGNNKDALDGKVTTIDGTTEINARNYKSTIITDKNVKNAIQGSSNNTWHLNMNKDVNTSVAVDDLKERLSIPTLKYDTFDTPINISAYSKPFKIQVEYTTEQQQNMAVEENGNISGNAYIYGENEIKTFEPDLGVFDFSIIERAREDIIIDKTISYIRLTLSNGQVLIDGNPQVEDLNYVKAVGIRSVPPFSPLEKMLTMEIDSELIQGATLQIWYKITVANNSEIDYEYEGNYEDINQTTNFITRNEQAKYYYYGEKKDNEHALITSTIELVADYMNSELVCNVGEDAEQLVGDIEINNGEWFEYDGSTTNIINPTLDKSKTPITYKLLSEKNDNNDAGKGYISPDTSKVLKEKEYKIFVTDAFKDLKAGEQKESVIYASKLLANKDEDNNHLYDNHVEILQLNGKVARTIDRAENGTQIIKTYKSGNYIPSIAETSIEQDDDRVRIIITPPTGILNYIATYVIVAVIGLAVIVCGGMFIKKKVLNK